MSSADRRSSANARRPAVDRPDRLSLRHVRQSIALSHRYFFCAPFANRAFRGVPRGSIFIADPGADRVYVPESKNLTVHYGNTVRRYRIVRTIG